MRIYRYYHICLFIDVLSYIRPPYWRPFHWAKSLEMAEARSGSWDDSDDSDAVVTLVTVVGMESWESSEYFLVTLVNMYTNSYGKP